MSGMAECYYPTPKRKVKMMLADEIAAAGWSYGITELEVAFVGRICFVDAHRGNGHHFIAKAGTMLAALAELRKMLRDAESKKKRAREADRPLPVKRRGVIDHCGLELPRQVAYESVNYWSALSKENN